MTNLRDNPQAVAAARRIEAQTGFDVLDEAKVAQAVALCRRQRTRARRWAAISGLLTAAIVAAWTVAGALSRLHGYQLAMGAALFLLNGTRMIQALVAARRAGRIIASIEAARAEVEAVAAAPPPRRGPARPDPGMAHWN